MNKRNCKEDDCKKGNGNCAIPGLDNLPIQCVGPWVEDKYYYLENYLKATRYARKKFTDGDNSVFIDLFAGPGKCIIRSEQREIDSGGTRVLNIQDIPFNEYYYVDIAEENIISLKSRIGRSSFKINSQIIHGDSNIVITDLVKNLLKNEKRYHVAYIDPFGPDGLKFNTLKELAKLQRMDILLHFPIGAIKRNLENWKSKTNTILDDFMGTDAWRKKIEKVSGNEIFKILIDVFKGQLKSIGYPENGLNMISSDEAIYSNLPTVPIKNTKDVDLYVLIFAAKHPLAQKIWSSIIKTDPYGNRNLF